ncbi:addiction module toxin, RelE/StbE family [Candidatus Symbiothrix dinenymphae]|nr:addiction module toxin, RelE/StbE family [Candidatus Symbiothrix dinenymphae]
MYYPKRTGQFKKDYKLCMKRNFDMALIDEAMKTLCATGTLPEVYLPHPLTGNYAGHNECHIKPDWLMTWYIESYCENPDFEGTAHFVRTGTHSDLFK